jgi:RNase P subunit RPR2
MIKDIAKEYCTRYPEKPSRWIARLMISEHTEIKLESARSAIRTVRGKSGDLKRYCRRNEQEFWKQPEGRPYMLILDIETAPMVGYIWGTFKQNISPSQLIDGPCMIGWSAKWLFDKNTKSDILTPEEATNRDDKRITESIWQWINKADIIIAHNGDKFDLPFLNSRFVVHGMKPPMPYQTIDTLKVAKANRWGFRFSSNRLDSICLDLGLPRKIHTDFSLWSECLNGNKKALKDMEKYNRNDVGILEEVYVRLMPWIKSHPNIGLYMDTTETVCPNCGNVNLTWEGEYYTMVGKYSAFRCDTCGAVGRSRFTALSKSKRDHLATTTAR